jgi:hypothetical protein
MTTVALNRWQPTQWLTPSSNRLFPKRFDIAALGSVFVKGAIPEQPTLIQQLDEARHNAHTIVRNKISSLGVEASSRALTRLSELINDDNWEEEDAVPTRQSMETLFDAVARADPSFTSLSIALGGALKATWIDGGRTITAVGRDGKQISWSKVEETSDSFITETDEGSIEEFLGTFGH